MFVIDLNFISKVLSTAVCLGYLIGSFDLVFPMVLIMGALNIFLSLVSIMKMAIGNSICSDTVCNLVDIGIFGTVLMALHIAPIVIVFAYENLIKPLVIIYIIYNVVGVLLSGRRNHG